MATMRPPTALVTHAQAFAGPPAVQALAAAGFAVIAHDPGFADAHTRAAFLAGHPAHEAVAHDDPAALVAHAAARGEGIAALVSNDVYPAVHAPFASARPDDLRATLEQLVVWPFRLLQAAIPELRRAARARVVLVTSCRTALPQPGGAIPDAARAAANALVTSLAIELAPQGIPVNAVAPNFLYSEAYYPRARFIDDPSGRDFVASQVPAGRLGRPDEIGELIRYLATMDGSFQTGTVIPFAGGWPAGAPRPA